jgi:hypothetical protein
MVVAGNSSQNENTFLQKNLIGLLYYDPLADVCILYDLTLFYSESFYFVYFSCTAQIHKLKFKSEYYLRINIGNQVKMQTPAVTLWFPKLGFFILEKQLASKNMFPVRSEVEVRLRPTYNSYAIQTFSIQRTPKRKITVHSHKHSFPPYPSLSPYRLTDRQTDRQIHSLPVGWRNLFSSCAVVSVFGSGGK